MDGPYDPNIADPNIVDPNIPDPNIPDPNFVAWADSVVEISIGESADIVTYPAEMSLGPAQGDIFHVACLGRGGSITLSFSTGIGDKPGYDLAVFENSVNDVFLELGWVEVSSDGINFFRFWNHSLTEDPVDEYARDGGVDPTNITGFAGKYRRGYGTPFDLAELRDVSPLLDVADVRFVRIIDVIGDGNSLDSEDNPIYDPYKTKGTAGFDLDAIGVMSTRSGDIDEDGAVDPNDLQLLAEAWLTDPNDANWDARCDVAFPVNKFIDLKDFAVLSKQWFIDVLME
jgi:hypothetical protein